MKIYIIDVRNIRLGSKLSLDSNYNSPIVSTMLPNPDQGLSDDIKAALELYLINDTDNNEDKHIHISIEVNKWVNREHAENLLQHMYNLIANFFIDLNQALPFFHLSLFEDNDFTCIEKINKD